MTKRVQLVFFLACLGALFSSVGLAQGIGDRNRAGDSEGKYTIKGRVYLPDGKPAQNLRVDIESTDSGNSHYYTDLEGVFQTGSIRAGNFTVIAKIEGLPVEREFLTIDRDQPAGSTMTVTLFLRNEGQKKGDFFSNNPAFKEVPKPALDLFKKGMEKLQKDDGKAAVAFFDQAIAAYPNFAVAYHQKGAALLKANDPDQALVAFVKAIELKPDYVEAKYSVGYTQYLKKNYEVAAAIFDDVVKQKPEMIDAEMYRGISLFYLKNVDAAEASLQKTIATPAGGKMAMAHLYLGQIYISRKKNAEAAAELEKYLELVPKAPNAEKLKSTIADLKKKT
ncbi:MAG TPA: tetratricopeptide repeat protein [Pyrinomonadaceae bacterium]|nr:tetratricopeptide repeat protein [Pyrinomonadaceae bacterium]